MTTTTKILDPQLDVVGVGVYLEMRREHAGTIYTSQMLVIPEVHRADITVPVTMLSRRLTKSNPKRNWRQHQSPTYSSVAATAASTAPTTALRTSLIAKEILKFAVSTLERHVNAGYKCVGDPIFFEVTREDAAAIRVGKTPYKVIGRVNKVRKELKYPAELVA